MTISDRVNNEELGSQVNTVGDEAPHEEATRSGPPISEEDFVHLQGEDPNNNLLTKSNKSS